MRRALIASLFVAASALAADDTPDVVSRELKAGKDANKRYYLLSRKREKAPKGGLGWRGPLYADVKKGIEWLEKQTAGKK